MSDASQLIEKMELLLLKLGRVAKKKRDYALLDALSELWEYVVNLDYVVNSKKELSETLVN